MMPRGWCLAEGLGDGRPPGPLGFIALGLLQQEG